MHVAAVPTTKPFEPPSQILRLRLRMTCGGYVILSTDMPRRGHRDSGLTGIQVRLGRFLEVARYQYVT